MLPNNAPDAHKTRRRKIFKRILLVCVLLAAAGLALLAGLNLYVVSSAKPYILTESEASELEDVDCIIVLGALVYSDGTMSDVLRHRVEMGTALFEAGVSDRILMSGDHSRPGYDEVGTMKDYAVAAGVTDCDSLKKIDAEKRLLFRGFIGCYTSVYVDAASAVYKCAQAGIEPVVRTDESYYSAVSHAKNAGIITDESQVITGEQLRGMDEGLYIANSPDYKVYRGVTDAEWLRVLRLRKEDGKAVAVTAERMEDLTLMSEADATFVSNSQAPETILQSADVLIDAGGFDVIARVLECARSIYKRVYAVVQYLVVAYAMLVFSALLSLLCGLEFPARVTEIVFAGFGANLLFALALAFAPTHRKILTDKIPRYTARPRLADFAVPLGYAGGGALALLLSYFAGSAEAAHARVLVTMVLLLAAFAFSGSSKQSLVTSRAYRNYLLLPALALSLAGMALLLYYAPAREAFGYALPGAVDLLTAAGAAALNFVCLQLALFVINKIKTNRSRARAFAHGAAEKGE